MTWTAVNADGSGFPMTPETPTTPRLRALMEAAAKQPWTYESYEGDAAIYADGHILSLDCMDGKGLSHNEAKLSVAAVNALPQLLEAVEAAIAFEKKLTQCQPHIDNAFVTNAIHGQIYNGPNYGAERDVLRKALAQLAEIVE